jgi:hypothetical protein
LARKREKRPTRAVASLDRSLELLFEIGVLAL